MIARLFVLAIALLLGGCLFGGCTHLRPALVRAPDFGLIKRPVAAASARVFQASGNLQKVAAHAATARAIVQQLEEQGTAAPATLQLAAEITEAQQGLQLAQTDLEAVHVQLAEADQRSDQLSAETLAQTEKFNVALGQVNDLQLSVSHQTRLAWKWRLIAAAELAAVGAFFVARQYLPFLKLL